MTRRVWIAFSALCTLSACSWLLPPLPDAIGLFAAALAYTLLSAISATAGWWVQHRSSLPTNRHQPRPLRLPDSSWKVSVLCLAATGAISGPAMLSDWVRHMAGPSVPAAMLSLVPIAAAVAEGARRGRAVHDKLVPGTLALGGMLSLVPVAEPSSASAWWGLLMSLCIAVLLGASIALCGESLGSMPLGRAICYSAAANALVFWIAVCFRVAKSPRLSVIGSRDTLLTILFEAITGALTLWLLRSMPSVSYSTRYLWTPLIVAAEGYLALRPSFSWRTMLGVLLIAGSGTLLMRHPDGVPDEVLHLR